MSEHMELGKYHIDAKVYNCINLISGSKLCMGLTVYNHTDWKIQEIYKQSPERYKIY